MPSYQSTEAELSEQVKRFKDSLDLCTTAQQAQECALIIADFAFERCCAPLDEFADVWDLAKHPESRSRKSWRRTNFIRIIAGVSNPWDVAYEAVQLFHAARRKWWALATGRAFCPCGSMIKAEGLEIHKAGSRTCQVACEWIDMRRAGWRTVAEYFGTGYSTDGFLRGLADKLYWKTYYGDKNSLVWRGYTTNSITGWHGAFPMWGPEDTAPNIPGLGEIIYWLREAGIETRQHVTSYQPPVYGRRHERIETIAQQTDLELLKTMFEDFAKYYAETVKVGVDVYKPVDK